jgi:hypothetical protein
MCNYMCIYINMSFTGFMNACTCDVHFLHWCYAVHVEIHNSLLRVIPVVFVCPGITIYHFLSSFKIT